jgi:hypothetical protein
MLVQVDRPYGGAEGKRVRVGQRFWVKSPGAGKKPQADLREISHPRYVQLKSMKLVSPVAAGDTGPGARSKVEREPRNRVAPDPRAKVLPDSAPPKAPGADPKKASKAAAPKSKAAPGSRPGGRSTGETGQPSSSQAGRPTKPSTLKQRGVRRGDRAPGGSPSTTPTASPPGASPSTPATPVGGATTAGSEDSTAFV